MAVKTKPDTPMILGNQSDMRDSLTFSGADITAVVYRNTLSLLDPESVKLRKEVNRLEQARNRIDRLKDDLNRLRESDRFYGQNGFLSIENRKSGDSLEESIIEEESGATKISEKILSSQANFPYRILTSLHTISYSSFREKFAVRSLGRTQPITYTRGPRTVAGSMVFSSRQEHELFEIVRKKIPGLRVSPEFKIPKYDDEMSEGSTDDVMLDQLNPLNIMLFFCNEYGARSVTHFFDVEISAEGQEMSIDKPITYNTINFYAKEMLTMKSMGNSFFSESDMILNSVYGMTKNIVDENKKKRASALMQTSRYEDNEISRLLASSRGLF